MLNEKHVNVEFETLDKIDVYADDFYMSQIITNYLTNESTLVCHEPWVL